MAKLTRREKSRINKAKFAAQRRGGKGASRPSHGGGSAFRVTHKSDGWYVLNAHNGSAGPFSSEASASAHMRSGRMHDWNEQMPAPGGKPQYSDKDKVSYTASEIRGMSNDRLARIVSKPHLYSSRTVDQADRMLNVGDL